MVDVETTEITIRQLIHNTRRDLVAYGLQFVTACEL